MHNIHWGVIFSEASVWVLIAGVLIWMFVNGRKDKNEPKTVGSGDKVKVTIAATGNVYTGVVEGVRTDIGTGRFSIVCNDQT